LPNPPTRPPSDPVGDAPCGSLAAFARKTIDAREDRTPDALCVFLLIHSCSCSKAALKSAAIRQLNREFAEICLQRARQLTGGSIPEEYGSDLWKPIRDAFKNNSLNYETILPLIAIGHILIDLSRAIHQTLQKGIEIDEDEYNSLLPEIQDCVGLTFSEFPQASLSRASFLRKVAYHLGVETISLKILRH
jgi:hypothetical protein